MAFARELRIGNIVNVNGTTIAPEGIGWGIITDLAMKERGHRNSYLDTLTIEPTPMAEEWLQRFEFKDVSGDQNGWGLRLQFPNNMEFTWYKSDLHPKDGLIIRWQTQGPGSTSQFIVKHVHTFQNLHFALLGYEAGIRALGTWYKLY